MHFQIKELSCALFELVFCFVVSSSSLYVQGLFTFHHFQGLLSLTLSPRDCVQSGGGVHLKKDCASNCCLFTFHYLRVQVAKCQTAVLIISKLIVQYI